MTPIQAREPPDQKRKRGRPPGALEPATDASSRERPEDNHNDVEEEARPKKRGRKSLKDGMVAKPASQDVNDSAHPGKRGRPPKSRNQRPVPKAESQVEVEVDAENPRIRPKQNPDPTKAASKSPKIKAKAPQAQENQEPPSSEPRRSGRERRSYNPEEMYSARRSNHSPTQFTSPPDDSSRNPPPPRRSSKPEQGSTPRRSERERRAWDAERLFSASRESVETQQGSLLAMRKISEKAKGKAPAKASIEEAGPKAQKLGGMSKNIATEKKRAGRPPRNVSPREEGSSRPDKGKKTQTKEDNESTTADAAQPRRRGRPRQSDGTAQKPGPSRPSKPRKESPQARNEQEESRSDRASHSRRGLEAVEEDSVESESEEDDTLPFRYLKETTRNIQRSTISDKWTPLDPSSIDAVSNFLADAQRPVLLRLQNTNQRRGYASSALGIVIRRLRSRLVKGVPFPAPTAGGSTRANAASYENDFDFERIVDAIQTLEHTLNPLLHSVSLLQKEITKEEAALARDYDSLHRLQTNAKAEAKEWREKTRREHVLAPGWKRKGEHEIGSQNRLELVPAAEDGASGGLFKVCFFLLSKRSIVSYF